MGGELSWTKYKQTSTMKRNGTQYGITQFD
jgi:hypothetical protein